MMTSYIRFFFIYLFIFLPVTLITGPAIPDLTITFGGIFGLLIIILQKKGLNLKKNRLIQISLLFWLSLIFISFFSTNQMKSFQDSIIYLRYLLIPICCYYIFFKEEKFFNQLLLVILISVTFVSIDTLYQFFNYNSKEGFGTDLLGFKSEWYGRLTGPFGEELIPGAYVSKFGLVGYVFLLNNKFFKNKFFIQSIYLSIILIVCFASGERMSFASYLLGLIILLFLLNNNRIVILQSLIIAIVSIFLIYKFHPFYNDFKVIESSEHHQGLKIEKFYECENDINKECSKILYLQPNIFKILQNFSSSAYGEIYLLSLEMFKDNPFTGIGISNFKLLCENENKYKKMMQNYGCASHPHNTYIQWLAEGGLIVFISFILYLYFIYRFIQNNEGNNTNKIISIVLLIILFWPIMSTGSLIKNWYGISVYFIISVSLCISRIRINN